MFKISLPLQILIAICIGTFLGVFLGPICSVFEPVGTAFIMFIQMVILLYIPSSIIHGLGSTSPAVARHLFRKGWVFLIFIWALIYFAIFLMNLLFPKVELVFNVSEMHSTFEQNFLNYLVPKNPIYDFANNIIPAIAIFAIIIGVALMHLTHKEPLISFLERVNNTIEKVLKGITLISPLGVMAIFANVTGNIHLADLITYGYYLFPLIILSLLLSFWAFPALLKACTPLKYREILDEFRSTCLLAFVIGAPSIAIPFLNQCVKRLAERFEIKDKELHNSSQMIVPLSYTFTQVGNLLILFFIMFLSYFYGIKFGWLDQVLVSILTIPMSFGGPELAVTSITFLIEKLGFPTAAVGLYDKTSIIAQNFIVLLSVCSMTTFATILLLGYYHRLSFNPLSFFKNFFPFIFVLVFGIFLTKNFMISERPIRDFSKDLSMNQISPNFTPARVYKFGNILPDNSKRMKIDDPLERIFSTNEIHIGYHPDLPPFSYFNKEGELVGYDIAYAYKLAQDLDATPVFIPFLYEHLETALSRNVFDIATSPILVAQASIRGMNFPRYYLSEPNVLVILRERQKDFEELSNLKKNSDLVIGTVGFFGYLADKGLPHAKKILIDHVEDISNFLKEGQIDALFWSSDQGVAYAREHPEFIVMEYGEKALGLCYYAFPVKYNAFGFIFFLNRWLELSESTGFAKRQKEYWMQGHIPAPKKRRWSLLKELLGIKH